jgi:hypothetical protein
VRLSLKRAACRSSTPLLSTGNPGEERSGEICGVSGPFLEMFFDRAYRDFSPSFVVRNAA